MESKIKRILIVEDDPDMQELYRDFFENSESKYTVCFEDNALTGLNTVRSGEFDLVILDIIMSPIPGDSFFVRVKGDARTAKIPVLIISVLDAQIIDELKKEGDFFFLQKPITGEQLFSKLDEIWGQTKKD